MEINVFNIVWDTDGEEVDLPTRCSVSVSKDAVDEFGIDNVIADTLSDAYGWCHRSFNYQVC